MVHPQGLWPDSVGGSRKKVGERVDVGLQAEATHEHRGKCLAMKLDLQSRTGVCDLQGNTRQDLAYLLIRLVSVDLALLDAACNLPCATVMGFTSRVDGKNFCRGLRTKLKTDLCRIRKAHKTRFLFWKKQCLGLPDHISEISNLH